jgi:copper transport protein
MTLMRRPAFFLALAAVAAATAVGARAGHVSAHASLASSDPADKQVLAADPSSVTLTFKQNLAAAPGSFIYVSTAGNDASGGPAQISASDSKTLSIPLKAGLADGLFSVFWKSTSADDGGVTFGRLSFFVGQPDPATLSDQQAGAAVAVPDAAADMAVSAGGAQDITLAAGCRMVASTFADGTPAATMAAAIAPATSVVVYRYDAAMGQYSAYANAAGGTGALVLNHLDAVWLFVGTAATLTEPSA